MAIKYSGNMPLAQVEAAIPTLKKRGDKFRLDIQHMILSLARHWVASGNVQPVAKAMTRIINEVEGYYAQALANYAMGMWSMTWDATVKALVYTETTLSDAVVKQMQKEPWWEFSPPKEVKGFDGFSELEKLLTKNAKKLAKPGDKDNVIPAHVVNALRRAMAEAQHGDEVDAA
jgi:hypothetical protein